MIFLKEPREALGRLWLKHRMEKQQPRLVQMKSLATLKSALVVFDASSENCYQRARRFSHQLAGNTTRVKTVGYLDAAKQSLPYISEKEVLFITHQDYNVLFLPKSPQLNELISMPFEALFVLTGNPCFPLKTFVTLSRANLKIGFAGLWGSALDLTFDIPGHDSEELVKQINHYLSSIKTRP